MIDRVSPRYCLTFCLLGISLTCFLFACSHTLVLAKTFRFFQGAFSAPSVIPALFIAATWFPSQRFALLAGLTEMIGMSGSALGVAILAPINGSIGWRSTLLCCAGLGILMAILTWVIVRDKNETPVQSIKMAKISLWQSLLIVIRYPQAWINGFYAGILFAIPAAFASFWSIPFLQMIYGINLNTAAAASSMTLFGAAIGAPIVGWVSDKLSLRRLPMIISAAVALGLMLVIIYVPNVPLTLMFFLLFTLGLFSSAYSIPYAVMRDIVPAEVRGTAMGYTNFMCILIGAPLLQPAIGFFLKWQSVINGEAYRVALSVLPVCLIVGLGLAFLVKETFCGNER